MNKEQRVEPVVSQKGLPYVNPLLDRCSTPKVVTMTTFMTSNKASPPGRERSGISTNQELEAIWDVNEPCIDRRQRAMMVICFTCRSRNRIIKQMLAVNAAAIASMFPAKRMDGLGRESIVRLSSVRTYLSVERKINNRYRRMII